MRKCPNCGQRNEDVNFCSSCGYDLRTQPELSVFCPYCGARQSSRDNVYCCKCGKRMKGGKKVKYLWFFFTLVVTVIVCSLMLFRQNGDDVPQETICQHEWQNNGVTSICTKCRGVIITPSDIETSSKSTNQNIVTETTEESEQEVSADEKAVQPAETAPKYPIAVDGGEKHSVILYSDGTVTTIGNDTYAQRSTSGWRDIVQISTFSNHTLGLKADGTVVAAGSNYQGQCDVSNWEDIVCVAAGTQHSVGLKRDGTVVAVGANGSGQCDVSDWTGIKYIAANATSTFALTEDGRILTCGSFQNRNLDNWQDIVSFSVSVNHVVGVHSDGTVSAVGSNARGQRDGLEKKQDVAQVAVGYGYTAGLKTNGKVWVNGCDEHNEHAAMQWTDIVAIGTGTEHILGIKKDGTLVAKGTNDDGQCDVYALNQILKNSEEYGASNSAGAMLQEYLDFSKSWGIRKSVSTDPNFPIEQVYDFAFMEDGVFYGFFYQQYTDFLYSFRGKYTFEDNQLKFYNDDELSALYVYSFDANEMKLTQISEKGLWGDSAGTEYDLTNDEWYPTAQDIIDSAKNETQYKS